ncbi:MAG TPA: type II secretion system F family protein [Lacipirellulaceae bacterium]|nr:type II secretion system F family protein [Lacipirellulaceae bacterium]
MDAILNNPWFQAHGLLVASVILAFAVGLFCWQLVAIVTYPRDLLGDAHPFERQRRQELRAGSSIFRWFEPLIEEVARIFSRRERESMTILGRSLIAGREKLPWRPEEFVAAKWIEGILIGVLTFALFWFVGWSKLGAVLAIFIALLYGLMTPKSVRDRAKKRLARIRLRLPFAVDLIALTMEAGGGFQECLQTAVAENGDHPLTEELSEVVRQISLGRPRNEALRAMQDRLQDDDINELVFAINKGEELGTPLSAILRDQAEQMRLKRSQRGEKAAAEAEVNIVFPGMVLMIACLLIVIAPIVLPAVLALL